MKKLLLLILISFYSSFLSAQQKDFEGIIAYKAALNSKKGIDAIAWETFNVNQSVTFRATK